jgi:hypothetical protein
VKTAPRMCAVMMPGCSSSTKETDRSRPCGPVTRTLKPPRTGSSMIHASSARRQVGPGGLYGGPDALREILRDSMNRQDVIGTPHCTRSRSGLTFTRIAPSLVLLCYKLLKPMEIVTPAVS